MNGRFIADFIIKNKLENENIMMNEDELISTVAIDKHNWIEYEVSAAFPMGMITHKKIERVGDAIKKSFNTITTEEALELRHWGKKLYG